MASHSVCRAWAPVFSSILHRQDICQKEAVTGTYCQVDAPIKVKETGLTSHIYGYLRAMGHGGTWYVVDAWIMDPSGCEKLAESTFLVPTIQPEISTDNYTWEWDMLLRMFIVSPVKPDAASNVANGTVNGEYEQGSHCIGQTGEEDNDNGEGPSTNAGTLLGRGIRPSQQEPAMDREHIDALLKPEHFNWADEDDDSVLSEDVQASQAGKNEEQISSGLPSGPLIIDSSQIRCQTPEPGQEPPVYGDDVMEDAEESEEQMLQENVKDEFNYREQMTAWASTTGWGIHHFNWFGEPVFEYSDTPPAVSLWYIMSGPKVSPLYDEMRVQSILFRALKFIDPVVYYGRDWRDLRRRGHDFIRAVTGSVFKCYTLHGTWRDDEKHFDEGTRMDEGILESYGADEYVIANGFTMHPAVMNRTERLNARKSLSEQKRSFNLWRYSSTVTQDRIYTLSPLRFCTSVDEKWDEENSMVNNASPVDRGLYTISEESQQGDDSATPSSSHVQVDNISGSTSRDTKNDQSLDSYPSSDLHVVFNNHRYPPDPHNVPRGRAHSKFHSLPKLVTPLSSVSASSASPTVDSKEGIQLANSDDKPESSSDLERFSKPTGAENQGFINAKLQPMNLGYPPDPHNIPRGREHLKCHSPPKLVTPFSFVPVVANPAVDQKAVDCHGKGKDGSLAKVPDPIPLQCRCKSSSLYSTGSPYETGLLEATTGNHVKTEGESSTSRLGDHKEPDSVVIAPEARVQREGLDEDVPVESRPETPVQPVGNESGPGVSEEGTAGKKLVESTSENVVHTGEQSTSCLRVDPEEDVKPTSSQKYRPRLSWRRFSGHISKAFGAKIPAEAEVRSGRKLQKMPPTPRVKSQSKCKPRRYIRRAANSILERLFVAC
ncbi:hypothetical protein Plec18170_000119 [Paecilomyces lecythidis]